MNPDNSQPKLDLAELRAKRIAALETKTRQPPQQQPPSKSNENNVNNTVIDLCDSDEDAPQINNPYAKKDTSKRSAAASQPKATTTGKITTTRPSKKLKSLPESSQSDNNSSSGPLRVAVATWNVWFGPMGDGTPHPGQRMRSIGRILQSNSNNGQRPVLFAGFQEVIDALYPPLQTSMGGSYRWFRQPSYAYGCAVAVHTSVSVLDHNWVPYGFSRMGRGFYYVRGRLAHSQDQVLFCTTHLESYTGKESDGSQERAPQLLEIQDFCHAQLATHSSLKVAIVSGDMNWDDKDIKKTRRKIFSDLSMLDLLETTWKDSWKECHGDDQPGYTYDGKENPMLSNNSLRRRFDRILFKAKQSTAPTVQSNIVGQEALPGLVWQKYNSYKQTSKEMPTAPSDHFGYIVQIEM